MLARGLLWSQHLSRPACLPSSIWIKRCASREDAKIAARPPAATKPLLLYLPRRSRRTRRMTGFTLDGTGPTWVKLEVLSAQGLLFYLRALRGSENLRKRTRFERIVVRIWPARPSSCIRGIRATRCFYVLSYSGLTPPSLRVLVKKTRSCGFAMPRVRASESCLLGALCVLARGQAWLRPPGRAGGFQGYSR